MIIFRVRVSLHFLEIHKKEMRFIKVKWWFVHQAKLLALTFYNCMSFYLILRI